MRLFKPSKQYYFMSNRYKILKFKNCYYTIQEYYDPHTLKLDKWVRDPEYPILFVLKKWKDIPLNLKALALLRRVKNESRKKKFAKSN